MGNEDDLSDIDDDHEEDNDNNLGIGRRKKTRKYKLESIEIKHFIFKLIISFILLETYFFVNYFLTDFMNDNMSELVKEMNVTS